MLDGIIKNQDNSYELLRVVNGHIGVLHITKNGCSSSNLEYIKSLLDKLILNKDCIYLKKFDGYNVYYDPKTKLQHFIKDNKEDYNMMLRVNGRDTLMYYLLDENNKISIRFMCILMSLLASWLVVSPNLIESYSNNHLIEDINQIAGEYQNIDITNIYNMRSMNYQNIIDCINNSQISESEKKILLNKDLLQDITKYYKNTPMEYISNLKFRNFSIELFDRLENNNNIFGYTKWSTPNVIYLRNDLSEEKKKDTLEHEWIHILQSDQIGYYNITEPLAELITYEYYGAPITAYNSAISILKLLIDIIGPEPVMKLAFGGNIAEFEKILNDNLDLNDAELLINYFNNRPSTAAQYSDDLFDLSNIKNILFKLYNNIYGHSIMDDSDLNLLYNDKLEDIIYSDNYYLNPRKMSDTIEGQSFNVNSFIKAGMIKKETKIKYYKRLSYQEYKMLSLDLSNNFKFNNIIPDSKFVYGISIYNEELNIYNFYLLKEPLLKENYINWNETRTYPGKIISIDEALKKGYVISELIKNKENIDDLSSWYTNGIVSEEYESLNSNIYNIGVHKLTFSIPSIKSRFPDQYERMIETYDFDAKRKK